MKINFNGTNGKINFNGTNGVIHFGDPGKTVNPEITSSGWTHTSPYKLWIYVKNNGDGAGTVYAGTDSSASTSFGAIAAGAEKYCEVWSSAQQPAPGTTETVYAKVIQSGKTMSDIVSIVSAQY